MTSSRTSTVITYTIIIMLILLAAVFQGEYDRHSPPFTTKLTTAKRSLLPAKILPYISFGFTNIIADVYWLRAIQDFVAWNGNESYFIDYFRNVTTLDPRFEYPYLFAILAVPQNRDLKTLDEIATFSDAGIKKMPTSWKIPFYLGTQYFLFTRKYERAEHYLSIAARVKGAPDGVYLTYSTYVARNAALPIKSEDDVRAAQALIKVIYNNSDNETIKKLAGQGLQEEFLSQLLSKGIVAYKVRYKKYPTSVAELEASNFVVLPPSFKELFTVVINKKDGSFKIIAK